jgi:hypothetical protein
MWQDPRNGDDSPAYGRRKVLHVNGETVVHQRSGCRHYGRDGQTPLKMGGQKKQITAFIVEKRCRAEVKPLVMGFTEFPADCLNLRTSKYLRKTLFLAKRA